MPEAPGATHTRVETSVILCAALACVVLAAVASIGQWPSDAAVSREDTPTRSTSLMPAIGPAPAFCKDQTWPNIDVRCLNRAERKVADAPAETKPGPAPVANTEPPAAPAISAAPPAAVADQNNEPSAANERQADNDAADSSTVGMSSADVWPAEPTAKPRRRSHHYSRGWNLPTSRSAW